MGKGSNSGPSESDVKNAQLYPELRDPVYRAIQDARKLYERGYQVPGLNRRQWEGVEGIEDAASRVGSVIDEPLEYGGFLGSGRGVGDAPGQEYLQGVYRQGAPTAGYGTQERILGNLMGGPGAGYGQQQQVLGGLMSRPGAGFEQQERITGGLLGRPAAGYGQQEAILGGLMGRPAAGYGQQERILGNLMAGPGAGFGQQQELLGQLGRGYGAGFDPTQAILGQAMGANNLDYIRQTAAGQNLQGNPQLNAVLADINRGTTQAYQGAIGSLEGQMSRAGQTGGSVESQLRARENEGLARALAANEAQVRYGDYATERGFQQQAGMALPGAFSQEAATRLGAAGQLGALENQRLGMRQAAAGQLGQMEAQRIAQQQAAAGQLGDVEARRIGQQQAAAAQLGDVEARRIQQQQAATGQLGQMEAQRIGQQQAAAGQLGQMEANRIAQQQGAAGQLNDMAYRRLQAEMEAAQAAGGGYRQDIGQALQAGGLMPALGQAQFGPAQQLLQAGELTRAMGERQANAPWENFSRYLESLRGISGMTQPGAGLGGGPSPSQQISQNLFGIAGLGLRGAEVFGWSDRRLKTDIVPVAPGLYRWRYIWGGPVFEGPMAQDVAAVAPELVTVGPGGYLLIPAALIRRIG